MLMSFVVPEIILGVTALYVVLYLFSSSRSERPPS